MSNGFKESSSNSITDIVKGSHEYVIKECSFLNGMGVGSFVSSNKFEVGGYDWRIRFYPDGYKSDGDLIYVELASDGIGVEAILELTLIDQSGKGKHKVCQGSYTFEFIETFWSDKRYDRYIEKTALKNSDFLKDDCLVINCTVGVIRNRAHMPKQIPPFDMGQSLKELMESGTGTDVTFELGEETFRAHKVILAAQSPVFKAQFFGVFGNKDVDKVSIKEVEPSVFKAILLFMYSDKLPLSAPTEMVQNILTAADRFGLDRLKLLCELRLCEEVTTNTVATTLVFAEKHHCSQLKTVCLEFVVEPGNLGEVMKSDGFRYLEESCPELLLELLQTIAKAGKESNLQLTRKESNLQLTRRNESTILKKDLTLLKRVKCWLTQWRKDVEKA